MPNRIIKESICRSDNLDRLSAEEECFFYRLLVQCDDFGRYDGRPAIIKGACFPLKEHISTAVVAQMMESLVRESLIFMFTVDGLPYIQMTKWGKHQQIRAKRSKYPEPNGDSEIVISDDINGHHPDAGDSKCPRNPIQSNPIRNPIQSNPIANYSETDSLIDYLNELTGSRFQHSKESRRPIHARLAEGATADDIRMVFDWKAAQWMGDPEWQPNLNPGNLCKPTTFETNVNAAIKWVQAGRPPLSKHAKDEARKQAMLAWAEKEE